MPRDRRGGPGVQQSFSGNIVLLADQRPFIRITQPEKMSLATPDAALPVVLSAEDDCGISRLQLFRSLNDSRPLPADLPLPPRPPCRVDERSSLPLAQYGLEPGDVIKLFGRVEDNDPAGAKGAESPVVAVRIISQEEFEQHGPHPRGHRGHVLEILRRPAADGSAGRGSGETPRRSCEKLPRRRKARRRDAARSCERLQQQMRKEAAAMRKSSQHKLPYDLDKNLDSAHGAIDRP